MIESVHPYQKIKEGKDRVSRQRQKYSGLEGKHNHNPSGQESKLFTDMMDLFETLGLSEQKTELGSLRQQYEAKINRKVLALYNTFLMGKKGSPTHREFRDKVSEEFLVGFSLYLKIFLRHDMADAPKPHEPEKISVTTMGGKRDVSIPDEKSAIQYQRDYLVSGKDVVFTKDKKPSDHGFDRESAMTGYQQYQPVFTEDAEKSAMAAYMFEKFRLFEQEFFSNAETALSHGVDNNRAIDFAKYSYGVEGKWFDEMAEYGLTPVDVANYAINNRTSAVLAFDTYKRIGKGLEEVYPYLDEKGTKHAWVHGPKVIQKYIFQYPTTIEVGVQVVDRELPKLKEVYPIVPQRILAELCIKYPTNYEEEISKFVSECATVTSDYSVPKEWAPEYQGKESLFAFYGVEPEAFLAYHRARKAGTIQKVVKNSEMVHAQLRQITEHAGTQVSKSVSRQIVRTFLLRNISVHKAVLEMQKFSDRMIDQQDELYAVVQAKYPFYSENYHRYMVELGYGATPEEVIENGKLLVDLIEEGKNPGEAVLFIEECIELFYRYLAAGFPDDEKTKSKLKDAISMDPVNPKTFYETVLHETWPADIPVLNNRQLDE